MCNIPFILIECNPSFMHKIDVNYINPSFRHNFSSMFSLNCAFNQNNILIFTFFYYWDWESKHKNGIREFANNLIKNLAEYSNEIFNTINRPKRRERAVNLSKNCEEYLRKWTKMKLALSNGFMKEYALLEKYNLCIFVALTLDPLLAINWHFPKTPSNVPFPSVLFFV